MKHLHLLNAFLALRFRQPGWPSCLDDLSYLLQTIGVTFKLVDGTRIAPDVITSHVDKQVTLLIEVKGGNQVGEDQLRRMCRVTAVDLRDSAYLPVPTPEKHIVQVVYVCNEEHRTQIAAKAVALDPHIAVVGFDGERFRLSGAALVDPDLGRCLSNAQVSPGAQPLAIMPFDVESPNEDVARAVLPVIVDAWQRGSGTLSLDHVIGTTHALVHDLMAPTGSGSERKGLRNKAKVVLDGVIKGELSDVLEAVPGQQMWRFRKVLPRDSNRTRELQRVLRAAEKYLESQGSGRAVQLKLLESDVPPAATGASTAPQAKPPVTTEPPAVATPAAESEPGPRDDSGPDQT